VTEIGIMVRRLVYWQLPTKYLCLFLKLYLFHTIIPKLILEGWDLLIRIISLWPRFEQGALTQKEGGCYVGLESVISLGARDNAIRA